MSYHLLPLARPLLDHHLETMRKPMMEWDARKTFPPVLLFFGPEGIGKRAFTHHFAQWLSCQDRQSDEILPCGKCSHCQKLLRGAFVDVTEILPDEGEMIKIDPFRNLKTTLGFTTHEGLHRIVLIPNVERMTIQAANSILKIFEEPPPQWIFLLTASDIALVLPTVLSRCQSHRLKPLPLKTLLELLSAVPVERRDVCARAAQGSLSRALALAEDEVWDQRKVIFSFLKSPSRSVSSLIEWATTPESRNAEIIFDLLEQLISELLHWSQSQIKPEDFSWISTDGTESLVLHASGVLKKYGRTGAQDFWIQRGERLAAARRELNLPLNRKLLVQDVLLPWLPWAETQ